MIADRVSWHPLTRSENGGCRVAEGGERQAGRREDVPACGAVQGMRREGAGRNRRGPVVDRDGILSRADGGAVVAVQARPSRHACAPSTGRASPWVDCSYLHGFLYDREPRNSAMLLKRRISSGGGGHRGQHRRSAGRAGHIHRRLGRGEVAVPVRRTLTRCKGVYPVSFNPSTKPSTSSTVL